MKALPSPRRRKTAPWGVFVGIPQGMSAPPPRERIPWSTPAPPASRHASPGLCTRAPSAGRQHPAEHTEAWAGAVQHGVCAGGTRAAGWGRGGPARGGAGGAAEKRRLGKAGGRFRGELVQYVERQRAQSATYLFESHRHRPYSTRRIRQLVKQYADRKFGL